MSTRKKVFVTREIPEAGLKMLEEHFDLKVRREDSPIPRDQLMEEIKDCDGVLTILTDKMDPEVMDSAPNLKIISNFAVGYDNIQVPQATQRGIAVGNTPEVLTQSTAEHALALIMSVAKRTNEGDMIMREDSFPGWGPMYMLGTELEGKTVGIIGYGRIGKKLGEMMEKAFDCKIIYMDHSEKPAGKARKVELDELLKESDIVSVHVPLNDSTRHFIGEKEMKMMKKTAYLINTARGPVVDEEALLKALQDGTIRGAAMDVFEKEPRRLAGLEKCKNVVMTPHTASATWEARTKMSEVAAQNIIGVLIEGQKPVSILNPEVLAK
ncbi:D-glycerate dehydrogenase [Candidatus Gracilibacteria bacterium]|nr:D-glycerate dehydrogenase [Candidatus Gracilibacteria bacterium]